MTRPSTRRTQEHCNLQNSAKSLPESSSLGRRVPEGLQPRPCPCRRAPKTRSGREEGTAGTWVWELTKPRAGPKRSAQHQCRDCSRLSSSDDGQVVQSLDRNYPKFLGQEHRGGMCEALPRGRAPPARVATLPVFQAAKQR